MKGFSVFRDVYGIAILVWCGWLAFRPAPAELMPPDPTASEARALIVGLGCFWSLWAPFAITIDRRPAFSFLFAVPTLAAGAWFGIAGFGHIAARMSGMTLSQLMMSGRARRWRDRDRRRGYLMNVAYFRRAATILGWPAGAVFTVLGLLLVGDLAILVATVHLGR